MGRLWGFVGVVVITAALTALLVSGAIANPSQLMKRDVSDCPDGHACSWNNGLYAGNRTIWDGSDCCEWHEGNIASVKNRFGNRKIKVRASNIADPICISPDGSRPTLYFNWIRIKPLGDPCSD